MEYEHGVDLPIESWIRFAVDRNVAELELTFIPYGRVWSNFVPDTLFLGPTNATLFLVRGWWYNVSS